MQEDGPEGYFWEPWECIQLQKGSWHYWVAQHDPDVPRFIDKEVVFCST